MSSRTIRSCSRERREQLGDRRHLEVGELEARRDGTAAERPGAPGASRAACQQSAGTTTAGAPARGRSLANGVRAARQTRRSCAARVARPRRGARSRRRPERDETRRIPSPRAGIDQRAAATRQAARVPRSGPFDAKPRAEHFAKVPAFGVGNEAKSLDDVANVFSHAVIAQGLVINMIFSHDAYGGSRRCARSSGSRRDQDGIPRHAQAPRLVVRLDRRARRARRGFAVGVGVHLPPMSGETLIAELRFDQSGDREYAAHLRTGDRCDERVLAVYGDQWRVDAEFLKWKYWALLLGLDSHTASIGSKAVIGRSSTRTRSRSSRTTPRRDGGRRREPRRGARPVEFPDRRVVWQLDVPGHRPRQRLYVYRTQTAIITRSKPRPVPEQGTPIAVDVDRACGAPQPVWYRVTTWTDERRKKRSRTSKPSERS